MCAYRAQRNAVRVRETSADCATKVPLQVGTNFDGFLDMTNRQTAAFALLWLLPCLSGCSSDEELTPSGPFAETKDVQTWANSASALGVYANVYQELSVADGNETYADPSCPTVTDDGTTWTAHGDCTDSDGRKWNGQASIVREGDDRVLTLDGFQGNDGTLNLHQVEADLHEFEANLVIGGVTTIDYVGSVQGGYSGPTLWNGNGHVERQGVIAPNGAVDASTLDERVDNDVCAGQAVAGQTTLKSGSDEAVITYDGESDCDKAQAAQLSVNGEERGLIEGISCAVVAPGAPTRGAAGVLSCLALGLLRRRARSAGQFRAA
jgi:hypothetical protein